MAAPSIRGQTAPVSGGSTTSPAGTQVGDLVIVFTFERLGAAGGSTLSINSGAGFAELRNHFHDDGSTDGALGVAWKVATQAGAQSYQGFTSSTGTPTWFTGCTVLQSGTFDSGSIVTTNGSTQTNNAVPNPPQVTGLTSSRDYLVLAIAAWHLGSAATNTVTAPTNYTNLVDVSGSATADLACSSRAISGATSEDPGTYGDNQAPNGTCSVTVAVPNPLPERTGDLAATDAVDTASVAGDVMIAGAASLTDTNDTATASGAVLVQGSSDVTDTADAMSASGEVTEAEGASGDLDATDAVDTAAAAGVVVVQGTIAPTDAADTASASGAVLVAGSVSATDSADTAEVDGSVVVAGALESAESVDAAAVAGGVLVAGDLDATDSPDEALFSAGQVATGNLAATDVADGLEAAGQVVISGIWVVTDGQDTADSLGTITVAGNLIGADSPDIAALLGNVVIAGSLAASEAGDRWHSDATAPEVHFDGPNVRFAGIGPVRIRSASSGRGSVVEP